MGSPSVVRRSKPPCGMAAFAWNQWQPSCGINGRLPVESVATFVWNQWQLSRGISGRFGVEYAPLMKRLCVSRGVFEPVGCPWVLPNTRTAWLVA